VRGLVCSLPLLLMLAAACSAPVPASPVDLTAAIAARVQAQTAIRGERPSSTFAADLRGRYVDGGEGVVEIFAAESELLLRTERVAAAPIRSEDGALSVWIAAASGLETEPLDVGLDGFSFADRDWQRDPGELPAPAPALVAEVLGVYTPATRGDNDLTLYLLEWEGQLRVQLGTVLLARADLTADGLQLENNSFGLTHLRWGGPAGSVDGIWVADQLYSRVLGVREGPTFKIDPAKPVEALRAAALSASPPVESAELRESDLAEVALLEPGIALDIRYATTNNFMGAVFYAQPRAFMQRPAAEALVGVHRRLAEYGYGLLIHDAYRPWFATKMFWDATPEEQRHFVADPAGGSRHNRGAAVDLSLFDLTTGEPVEMTGGYDEFSERSYPFFPGGTDRQRWHRELLRREMEAACFAVYEYEWWHYDFGQWAEYPILDVTFESLDSAQ